jgi:hypothetical protein
MKIVIELPDELYRRAKAVARRCGRKIKDLVEEGLRMVVDGPAKFRRKRTLAEPMRGARGLVDPGVPDLASNPRRLAGFGRNAGHC